MKIAAPLSGQPSSESFLRVDLDCGNPLPKLWLYWLLVDMSVGHLAYTTQAKLRGLKKLATCQVDSDLGGGEGGASAG